ncbi:MAG: transcription termination factor NusA [Anaerolineae bacterium]
MKSEFALAFNQICAEYSLPREVVLDAVRAALATAFRRDWKLPPTQNVGAEISLETGQARIFVERTVVKEVEDEQTEISLKSARRKKPGVQEGEAIMVDVTPKDFGRIAAQTAKQVITQRLREAERESQFNRFSRQENEIIIGTVQSINPHGVTLHLERTEEAHMPRREQIPGERYTLHQKIRVYVLEVRRTPRGPDIIVSRSHPLMLRRLLELEVPEIRNGQVEINAVAREAGTRAKVAVSARQSGIDPVGACVGMRGIRIQTISRELHGERIDVVEWATDPEAFISNALSVPDILAVTLDENNAGGRTASVVVLDEHLSLAIGRSGQNARLAAKLTNWRIDIQGAREAAIWALEHVNQTPDIVDSLRSTAAQIPRLASIVRAHEEGQYPYTDEERRVIGSVVKAVREVVIARRDAERPGASQARARQRAQRKVEAERVKAKEEAQARVPRGAYKVPLSDLDLADKVYGHLINGGLESLGDVMQRMALGDEALLMVNGVGVKALREVKQAVEDSGLRFLDQAEGEAEEPTAEEIVATEEEEIEPVEEAATPELEGELEQDEIEAEAQMEPEAEIAEEVAASEAEATPEAEPEEGLVPELEAQPAAEQAAEQEEEQDEIEAIFAQSTDLTEIVEEFADVAYEEEAEVLEEQSPGPKKHRRNKGRRRAVLLDEETGETYVVHKHRRDDPEWDEFAEDY